jgi:enediyne biosynthesis protein E4
MFTDITQQSGLNNNDGWWCKIIPADIDNDGNIDFIAGNMGWNTQFKATANEPLTTYAADFNGDGKVDPIITWFVQGKPYLFNSRDEMLEQLPGINKRFLKYADYAEANIDKLFEKLQIDAARKFYIKNTSTSFVRNNGKGFFTLMPLPLETQFSPVMGILYNDYDGDGKKDILTAGNFFPFRVQQGRCDAGTGSLLRADGNGNFKGIDISKTGLFLQGDIRDMLEVKGKKGRVIVISKNSGGVQVIKNNYGSPIETIRSGINR